MSAETLRKAAALIRERAEAATPAPWTADVLGSEGYAIMGQPNPARRGRRTWVARVGMNDWEQDKDTAQYIASWHPSVAVAVADWLDECAEEAEQDPSFCCEGEPLGICGSWHCANVAKALVVARAYLGEAA